jgi:hypothetical protein
MTPYLFLVGLHAVTAVCGVGLLGAVPIGALTARRHELKIEMLSRWLTPLMGAARVSLVAMFATGAAVDYAAGGLFHERGWFRASVLLLVVSGISLQLARAALRRGVAGKLDAPRVLSRVGRWGLAAASAIAGITWLMELKPF